MAENGEVQSIDQSENFLPVNDKISVKEKIMERLSSFFPHKKLKLEPANVSSELYTLPKEGGLIDLLKKLDEGYVKDGVDSLQRQTAVRTSRDTAGVIRQNYNRFAYQVTSIPDKDLQAKVMEKLNAGDKRVLAALAAQQYRQVMDEIKNGDPKRLHIEEERMQYAANRLLMIKTQMAYMGVNLIGLTENMNNPSLYWDNVLTLPVRPGAAAREPIPFPRRNDREETA